LNALKNHKPQELIPDKSKLLKQTFVDVDLNLRFEDLAFALKKKFGADVTFEASKGKPVDSQVWTLIPRPSTRKPRKSSTSNTISPDQIKSSPRTLDPSPKLYTQHP
jgi:hypothetical protein